MLRATFGGGYGDAIIVEMRACRDGDVIGDQRRDQVRSAATTGRVNEEPRGSPLAGGRWCDGRLQVDGVALARPSGSCGPAKPRC